MARRPRPWAAVLAALVATADGQIVAQLVDPAQSSVAWGDTDGVRHAGEPMQLLVELRDTDGELVLLDAAADETADALLRLSAYSADLPLCQGVRLATAQRLRAACAASSHVPAAYSWSPAPAIWRRSWRRWASSRAARTWS